MSPVVPAWLCPGGQASATEVPQPRSGEAAGLKGQKPTWAPKATNAPHKGGRAGPGRKQGDGPAGAVPSPPPGHGRSAHCKVAPCYSQKRQMHRVPFLSPDLRRPETLGCWARPLALVSPRGRQEPGLPWGPLPCTPRARLAFYPVQETRPRPPQKVVACPVQPGLRTPDHNAENIRGGGGRLFNPT